jgi:DNA-binding SARP family transcriptional activator
MKSKSVPVQEMLLKQIISEAGIVKKEHKQGLKKYFDKRFAQQINLMQYHRLREDRFIQSQKRVLEKQNYSIQKAKEYIELRQ